jgi:hypothetical protein
MTQDKHCQQLKYNSGEWCLVTAVEGTCRRLISDASPKLTNMKDCKVWPKQTSSHDNGLLVGRWWLSQQQRHRTMGRTTGSLVPLQQYGPRLGQKRSGQTCTSTDSCSQRAYTLQAYGCTVINPHINVNPQSNLHSGGGTHSHLILSAPLRTIRQQ